MKIFKRLLRLAAIIIIAFVIGYFVYTGCRV